MFKYKVRKLSYTEWLRRVDEFLSLAIDRTAMSFQGIIWVKLYDVGCSPGECVDALLTELQNVEKEESAVAATN